MSAKKRVCIMAGEKLLVVEDDSIIAMEIRDRLERMGYDIMDVLDRGEDVLPRIKDILPDLILMDIILKGDMDGIEAAAQVKTAFDVPVIYLTAHADQATLERAKVTEPSGYVLKPFVNRELQTNIDMALYKHKMAVRLKESEEKFRNLVETSTDWVWEVDEKSRYIYSSPKVTELLGYGPSEIVGKTPFDFMTTQEAERVKNEWGKILEDKQAFKCLENSNLHKNGQIVILETSGVPVYDNLGNFKGYRGIDRDITERKLAQDELNKKAAELAELNKQLGVSEKVLAELNASKDKFFSILAHDLRSPFNSILAFARLLVDDYDSIDKENRRKFAENIYVNAKTVFHLVENLLEWSRIQTGRIEYNPDDTVLKEVVASLMNMLSGNAIKKEIELVNEVKENLVVKVDERMIQSVFQNLIANAIKFTRVKGKITVSAENEGDFVRVSVADNGIGIKEEDLDKLFKIDVQHTTMGTAKETGTGLGLILCKELIQRHGGVISVHSKYGEGTTFSFTLPLSKLEIK